MKNQVKVFLEIAYQASWHSYPKKSSIFCLEEFRKTMLPAELQSAFDPHWHLYPKTYVAPKITFPLIDHLNGDLNKEVWSSVPWSDDFDDIRGEADAPSEDRPSSNCRTRFKALLDDDYLYIGAMLGSDFETQAHFTQRNSPIFQKDSDFEVFVDPFGSCQNYKELELNAINTVWNLIHVTKLETKRSLLMFGKTLWLSPLHPSCFRFISFPLNSSCDQSHFFLSTPCFTHSKFKQ